jgi:hypothetical protein
MLHNTPVITLLFESSLLRAAARGRPLKGLLLYIITGQNELFYKDIAFTCKGLAARRTGKLTGSCERESKCVSAADSFSVMVVFWARNNGLRRQTATVEN